MVAKNSVMEPLRKEHKTIHSAVIEIVRKLIDEYDEEAKNNKLKYTVKQANKLIEQIILEFLKISFSYM